jgi:hypothetical protein
MNKDSLLKRQSQSILNSQVVYYNDFNGNISTRANLLSKNTKDNANNDSKSIINYNYYTSSQILNNNKLDSASMIFMNNQRIYNNNNNNNYHKMSIASSSMGGLAGGNINRNSMSSTTALNRIAKKKESIELNEISKKNDSGGGMRCIFRMMKLMFSTLGLVLVVFLYSILGALMFQILEQHEELRMCEEGRNKYNKELKHYRDTIQFYILYNVTSSDFTSSSNNMSQNSTLSNYDDIYSFNNFYSNNSNLTLYNNNYNRSSSNAYSNSSSNFVDYSFINSQNLSKTISK